MHYPCCHVKRVQVIVVGAPAHRLNIVKEFGIDHTINIEEVHSHTLHAQNSCDFSER